MKPLHIILAAVVAVVALFAVTFRYEVIPDSSGGHHRVDRWTGRSVFVRGRLEHDVRKPDLFDELGIKPAQASPQK
jgi:hypothetical protein